MQSAHGGPTPFSRRRRRRPSVLLAALSTSACLTVPFAGVLPVQATVTATPAVIADTHDDVVELRSTSAAMWSDADALASRARSRAATPLGFSDVLAPAVRVPTAPGGIPLTNLNLPLVAGTPLGDAAALFATPYVSPVPGPITSPYGPRFHPILNYVRNHNGVDMTAACGTPIVAMTDGTVTRSGNAGGYGLLVEIDHGTIDEDRMSSRYAHLSVLGVTVGQKVSKGQQIGLAGTTGLSTGCHLHFEVLVNGAFVDPRAVLSGAPFLRLNTPMVPWTPGAQQDKPKGTIPKAPPGESGPLPDLDEVPLVPADQAQATPDPNATPTPDPNATPTPDPTDPGATPTPDPSPKPDPSDPGTTPDPTPTPEPTPEPSPEPTPDPPASPAPTPEAPADPASSTPPAPSTPPTPTALPTPDSAARAASPAPGAPADPGTDAGE